MRPTNPTMRITGNSLPIHLPKTKQINISHTEAKYMLQKKATKDDHFKFIKLINWRSFYIPTKGIAIVGLASLPQSASQNKDHH